MCTNTVVLEYMAVIAFACLTKIIQPHNHANIRNNTFPYKEFLNYTLGDDKYIRFFDSDINKKISDYLCTVEKGNKEKCCSCEQNCVGNCCIDALWESATTRTLQEYLDIFVERYKLRKCQPIIPVNTTDHVIEHLYMVHSYYNESEKIECPEETFPIPVRSTNGDVYISASCATFNNNMMFEPIEIIVSCEKATNISEGQLFSLSHIQKAKKCTFSVDKPFGAMGLPYCRNELSGCNQKNVNYDLCKAYLLRIESFRNPHCFLCDGKNSANVLKVKSCNYGKYVRDSILKNNVITQVSYKLFFEEEKQYIITNIKYPFPVKEFLGFSEVSDNFKNLIPSFLCSHSSPCCSCDRWCFKFQSCCMDILWNKSHPIEINGYKQLLVNHSKQYKKHTCEEFNATSYFTVSSCLQNASKVDLNNCLNQSEIKSNALRPVLGVDDYLYKNKFCARCNSIFSFHYPNFGERIEGGNEFILKNYTLRQCKESKRVCPSDNRYYDLCHSHMAYIDREIANFYCLLCTNSKEIDVKIDPSTCSGTRLFSELVSFNFLQKSSPTIVCNIGQTYNPAKSKCEQIRCQKHLKLLGSRCVPRSKGMVIRFIDIKKSTFESCFTNNRLKVYLESEKRSSVSGNICWYLNMIDCNSSNFTFSIKNRNRTTYIQKIESKLSDEFFKDIKSKYTALQAALKQNRATIRITSSSYLILSKFHNIGYLNNFPNNKICHKIRMLDMARIKYKSNCNIIYNERLYSWTNISAWIVIDKFKMTKIVCICEKFYMRSNCSSTFLPNSEIILKKDGSITYLKGTDKEKTYQVEEYVPTEKGVLICIQESSFLIDQWSLSAREVERYVSLICSSISLPSYIFVILTFSIFDQFHTIPGKCTLMLTSSLLFGDSLMLLASIIQKNNISLEASLCKAISISIHFALIIAQAWCFVIAIDLTLTFISTATLLMRRSTKRFHFYVATTVIFSLCTVTMSVLMDYFKVVKYDYAKNDVCIPRGSFGHLYFYLTPTLVCFTSSLILLITIMLKISYEVRRNQNVLGSNRTMNIASMALKLTLVLGLSEGIGFIQNPGSKGNEKRFFQIVGILYSFIRSLRGLFIALVYLCRKDVLDSWKEMFVSKFFKRKSIMRRTDTTTSSF